MISPTFIQRAPRLARVPLSISISFPDDSANKVVLSALQSPVHDGMPDALCPPVCCAGRAHTGRNGKKSSRRTVTSRSRANNISGTKPDEGLLGGALLLNYAAWVITAAGPVPLVNCYTRFPTCMHALGTEGRGAVGTHVVHGRGNEDGRGFCRG
ncbi:hypothetical protein BJV78DRAFT_239754 [Lactifluus subvellereus]|nr:hypothetical protein BJV78DRAFT_239754 [Lactifluus subvellereus]